MDIMAGIHFAAGILAALHQRDRTGEGLEVETSLFESAIGPLTAQISAYRAQGGSYERAGNRAPNRAFSPYNCYPASDGYVLLLTSDNQRWQALCTLMGREDIARDEKFATNRARSKHADEVDAIVSAWTLTSSKTRNHAPVWRGGYHLWGGPDRRRSPQRPPPARTRHPQGYRSSPPPVLSPCSVRPGASTTSSLPTTLRVRIWASIMNWCTARCWDCPRPRFGRLKKTG